MFRRIPGINESPVPRREPETQDVWRAKVADDAA